MHLASLEVTFPVPSTRICLRLTIITFVEFALWTVKPCSSTDVHRQFGATCRLHVQGQGECQETTGSGLHLLIAGVLLGSRFNTEDGGDMFLRHVGGLLPNYVALQDKRQ
jgi:hypothetical protein